MIDASILKPSAHFIWSVYQELRSVHLVGKELGMNGDRVHKILTGAGYRLNRSKWTEEEDRKLREYYAQSRSENFSMSEAARMLKRTEAAVALRASRLGVTAHVRKHSEETRRKLRSAWVDRLERDGPPNLGKKFGPLTEERKKEMSKVSIATMETHRIKGTGPFSESARQDRSDRMQQRHRSGDKTVKQSYSRGSSGRRADLDNRYFRSRWEANFARYLNWMQLQGLIEKWDYEADTFVFEKIKRGCRSYTPDFKITEPDPVGTYYVEIKGWMDQKSRTKLNRMHKYYPDVRVDLIASKEYYALMRQVRPLIGGWEGK